jgi:hypothetical protein
MKFVQIIALMILINIFDLVLIFIHKIMIINKLSIHGNN